MNHQSPPLDSANVSKLALTIAIRYGTVRRQFSAKEGEPEKQILNYASHQFRLMPLLALTFAMHFGGVRKISFNSFILNVSIFSRNLQNHPKQMQTTKNYSEMINEIEGLGPEDQESAKPVLDNLKAVHATSAGLKAFCT